MGEQVLRNSGTISKGCVFYISWLRSESLYGSPPPHHGKTMRKEEDRTRVPQYTNDQESTSIVRTLWFSPFVLVLAQWFSTMNYQLHHFVTLAPPHATYNIWWSESRESMTYNCYCRGTGGWGRGETVVQYCKGSFDCPVLACIVPQLREHQMKPGERTGQGVWQVDK